MTLLLLGACSRELPVSATERRAALARHDPALLQQSLEEIAAWHASEATGMALHPGADEAQIHAAAQGFGCHPPEELIELWRWHDGQSGAAPFVWYHDFLPLTDALAEYRWLLMHPLIPWDRDFVPVFSFEGEWYAVYCGPEPARAGPVLHFFLEDEARLTHVNLTVFFAGMAQALRDGALRWEDGAMREDLAALFSIHQALNPGYAFPYYVP